MAYVRQKELIISDLNIWKKDGKFNAIVEFVENGKVLKLFIMWEDKVKDFFGITDLPSSESELKELRRELKETYRGQ